MNKKIISVTLALVLLLSAAGCTSPEEEAEDTASQTQPAADELTVNWYNTAVAELNGQIYFLTDSRRDLYVMEEADGQPAARLVLEDLYANSIAAHGDYLYIYRCREEEQNSELYRYDPAQGGELEFLEDLINEEPWTWDYSADLLESSYMYLVGNYLRVASTPYGRATFLITEDAEQPLIQERLPLQYESLLIDTTRDILDYDDIFQITDWKEYSTSNPAPQRTVKYSNFDEDYFYFVIPGKGCYRNSNSEYPDVELNMHRWENIEEYFPNRYYAKMDIIGDWIYYNYGETGKARVNRHDLTRHEIILEG